MSNSNNDPLFLLVNSLTAAEKRHFKLYILRNLSNADAKFVQLFAVLDAAKDYNEDQILKKSIVSNRILFFRWIISLS